MKVTQEGALLEIPEANVPTGIDWDAYATQYDLMAKYNPSYHENIQILRSCVARWGLSSDAKICDLGAGTGNYVTALSKIRPDARYVHVDFDGPMNEIARNKYSSAVGLNVSIVEEHIQRLEFNDSEFDLIICINALYAISPQDAILRKIYRWLKPGGIFFVIDFGRQNRMMDWSWYILKNLVREHGLIECVRFLFNSIEIVKQNNRGRKNQEEGTYWLHSTHEFGAALTQAGFRVEELSPCYRGYCDLAVCRK